MASRSMLRVPHVALRDVDAPPSEPIPPLPETASLDAAAGALLERQQAARRRRAEARSLAPAYLEEIEARLASERAVERNLARGRLVTRAEIRRARAPARGRPELTRIHFPRSRPWFLGILGMAASAFFAVIAPFVTYFAALALLVG